MNLSDSFEAASVTKIVTATVVLQLVDEGKLCLDEAWSHGAGAAVAQLVHANVAKWPDHFGQATVRQLLQHTSGLPNYWEDGCDFIRAFEAEPQRRWSTWELLAYAAAMRPSCSLEKRGHPDAFSYADTNYLLLGLLIETITQQPLAKAFRDRVFDPAGMSATGTYCSFIEERPQGAPPLSHRYMGSILITGNQQHSADSFAAGGLVSTAGDLELLMVSLASGELFPIGGMETLAQMMSWVPIDRGPGWSYGLGLMKIDLDKQVDLLGKLFHGGRPQRRGYVWGHEGFGGAFALQWVGPDKDQRAILTGTTNNEARSYGDLVMAVVKALNARSVAQAGA